MSSALALISRANSPRTASLPEKKSSAVICHGCALRRRPRSPAAIAGLGSADMYAQLRYATSSGMSNRARWLGSGSTGAPSMPALKPVRHPAVEPGIVPRQFRRALGIDLDDGRRGEDAQIV